MAKYYLFIILFFCSFYSCSDNHFYQNKIEVNKPWDYNNSLDYQFNVEDNSISYTMLLSVDHSEEFSYNNLYIKINTTFPDNTTAEDIISLNIGDKKGGFLGDCSRGNCTETIALQTSFKFKNTGLHKISISQHSREQKLKDINSVSLILDKKK